MVISLFPLCSNSNQSNHNDGWCLKYVGVTKTRLLACQVPGQPVWTLSFGAQQKIECRLQTILENNGNHWRAGREAIRTVCTQEKVGREAARTECTQEKVRYQQQLLHIRNDWLWSILLPFWNDEQWYTVLETQWQSSRNIGQV